MNRARAATVVAAVVVLGSLQGCSVFDRGGDTPSAAPVRRKRTITPSYAEISARYNARVAKLDRVAAGADLVVTRPDENGEPRSDQLEGYIQFRRSRSLNLRIDKVGSTLFVMGSNEERYWWFDVSDKNRGWVGSHALARPELVERFGIPVHPKDLAELLGILPVDPAAPSRITWNDDGSRVCVLLATESGGRRMELDPVTFEPARIEVLDRAGTLLVGADLSKYVVVPVRGSTVARPRMASSFTVEAPARRTQVTIRLTNPENPAERQKDVNFDFDALVDRYAVDPVEDLDAQRPTGGRAGEGSP